MVVQKRIYPMQASELLPLWSWSSRHMTAQTRGLRRNMSKCNWSTKTIRIKPHRESLPKECFGWEVILWLFQMLFPCLFCRRGSIFARSTQYANWYYLVAAQSKQTISQHRAQSVSLWWPACTKRIKLSLDSEICRALGIRFISHLHFGYHC